MRVRSFSRGSLVKGFESLAGAGMAGVMILIVLGGIVAVPPASGAPSDSSAFAPEDYSVAEYDAVEGGVVQSEFEPVVVPDAPTGLILGLSSIVLFRPLRRLARS